MRMVGYCTECHRIRQVRVTRYVPGTRVPEGICANCEEADRGR